MRKTQRFIVLLAAAMATGLSWMAPAVAADVAADGFRTADFDGDGKVTWEEFRNRVAKVFGHLDQNHDGRLTGDELPPAVDRDGKAAQPGTVSAESFIAAAEEAFKTADRNSDGALSTQEWAAK